MDRKLQLAAPAAQAGHSPSLSVQSTIVTPSAASSSQELPSTSKRILAEGIGAQADGIPTVDASRTADKSFSTETPRHRSNEKEFGQEMSTTQYNKPFKVRCKDWFRRGGKLQPGRLLKQDIANIRRRYFSDWTIFNQLVFASAVYVFFTNLLPGITFASDLYVLTGETWGTIEVVFSTGLCGVIFSL